MSCRTPQHENTSSNVVRNPESSDVSETQANQYRDSTLPVLIVYTISTFKSESVLDGFGQTGVLGRQTGETYRLIPVRLLCRMRISVLVRMTSVARENAYGRAVSH